MAVIENVEGVAFRPTMRQSATALVVVAVHIAGGTYALTRLCGGLVAARTS